MDEVEARRFYSLDTSMIAEYAHACTRFASLSQRASVPIADVETLQPEMANASKLMDTESLRRLRWLSSRSYPTMTPPSPRDAARHAQPATGQSVAHAAALRRRSRTEVEMYEPSPRVRTYRSPLTAESRNAIAALSSAEGSSTRVRAPGLSSAQLILRA